MAYEWVYPKICAHLVAGGDELPEYQDGRTTGILGEEHLYVQARNNLIFKVVVKVSKEFPWQHGATCLRLDVRVDGNLTASFCLKKDKLQASKSTFNFIPIDSIDVRVSEPLGTYKAYPEFRPVLVGNCDPEKSSSTHPDIGEVRITYSECQHLNGKRTQYVPWSLPQALPDGYKGNATHITHFLGSDRDEFAWTLKGKCKPITGCKPEDIRLRYRSEGFFTDEERFTLTSCSACQPQARAQEDEQFDTTPRRRESPRSRRRIKEEQSRTPSKKRAASGPPQDAPSRSGKRTRATTIQDGQRPSIEVRVPNAQEVAASAPKLKRPTTSAGVRKDIALRSNAPRSTGSQAPRRSQAPTPEAAQRDLTSTSTAVQTAKNATISKSERPTTSSGARKEPTGTNNALKSNAAQSPNLHQPYTSSKARRDVRPPSPDTTDASDDEDEIGNLIDEIVRGNASNASEDEEELDEKLAALERNCAKEVARLAEAKKEAARKRKADKLKRFKALTAEFQSVKSELQSIRKRGK